MPITKDIGIKYQIVDESRISKVNKIPVIKAIIVITIFVCHNSFHLSTLSAKAPPNKDNVITDIPGKALINPIIFSDSVISKTIQAIAITLI